MNYTGTTRLIINPDPVTYIITGTTQNIDIVGSGDTTVSKSGDTYVIYTIATGTTASWGNIVGTLSGQTDLYNQLTPRPLRSDFVGAGGTTVTVSGDSVIIQSATPTGATVSWGNISGTLSDQVDLNNALQAKLNISTFSGYTGTTDTRFSGIETDIASLSAITTGNTQSISTLNGEFDSHTGNTDIHYTMDQITGYTSVEFFNSHTGDTGIHFEMSTITGFTDTTDFNTHTGDSTVHFTQGDISITQSQVSGLTSSLSTLNDGITGNTESINTLDSSDIALSGFTKSQLSLADLTNQTLSAGRLTSVADVQSNGDGTVSVGAGTGLIKTQVPSGTTARELANWGETKYVTWDTIASLPLIDNEYNFIYYQGSSNSIQVTTSFELISFYEDFTIGRAYRSGNEVTVRLCGTNLWNFNRRVQTFGEEVFPVVRASGMIVTEVPTRSLAITAGVLWAELVNRFTTNAKNTSTGDDFNYYYQDGIGGWTRITGNTQIDNNQYDEGDGSLATLANNEYGVHWIYQDHSSTLHVVYGQGTYTLTEAQNVQPPATLPGLVQAYSTLTAKIIIAKGASVFTEIESAFSTPFTTSLAGNHNDLGGLQGGDAGEYYHLSATEYALIDDITGNTSNLNSHTGDTSVHFTMDQITGYTSVEFFNSHTGDTSIHYEMSAITGYTTTSEFNTYTGATDTELGTKANKLVTINSLGAATYTVLSGDSNEIIEVSVDSTITLPTGLTTGFQVTFVNIGTGITVTFAAGTGATLRSKDSLVTLTTQYAGVSAYNNNGTWTLIGDLA